MRRLPTAPVLKAVLGTATFLWFAVHLIFAAVGVLPGFTDPATLLLFLATVAFARYLERGEET